MAHFVFLFALCRVVLALQVTPGSPCAVYCLDSSDGNDFKASDSTTRSGDIGCRDADYVTTDRGVKFRECVDCLQTSTKFAEGESDAKWYIYNLRYAISTCLFSAPAAPPNRTAHSPCDMDKACRPLKGALTSDGLQPAPQTSRDYCTADQGAFKRSNLSPCTKCLRATEGEAYLSNFMVALEAGCAQNPADGHVLGLSSSLFTADAVSAISPPPSNQDDKKGQPGLTGSAIAGIVVGVVLVFVFAGALFVVYWRRQETLDDEDSDDDTKGPSGPNYPYPPGSRTGMTRAFRRGDAEKAVDGKVPHFFTSSGEYYDHLRAESQANRTIYASDFTMNAPGSNNAIPTHFAYIPGPSSRAAGRAPSPPPSTHRPEKTNRPDTFAIQAYLSAAEESAQLAIPSAPPAPRRKASAAHGFRIPLAALPKLGIPKKPMLRHNAAETPAPGGLHRGNEMQISEPVMGDDGRFDEPATLYAERPPAPKQQKAGHYEDGYIEVPLRSGKSTLYGF